MPVSLRTIQAPARLIGETAQEYAARSKKPRVLLQKMVANKDFPKFKSLQKIADNGNVRLNFVFPNNTPDNIVVQVADKTNPTSREALTAFFNIFKSKNNQEPLGNITQKECMNYLKNLLSNKKKYPVEIVEFNPKEPFADKIQKAIREFANKRLFG